MKEQLNVRLVATILLALSCFFFVAQYLQQWIAAVIALLVGGIFALRDTHAKKQLPTPATMAFLAIALVVSSANFAIIASLMLMYGVAIGSLCIVDADWKRSLHYSSWFAVASIVAFTAMLS
jgi:lysylphosphatidylglycerol synthetase-like protein (DUF2156 family)